MRILYVVSGLALLTVVAAAFLRNSDEELYEEARRMRLMNLARQGWED